MPRRERSTRYDQELKSAELVALAFSQSPEASVAIDEAAAWLQRGERVPADSARAAEHIDRCVREAARLLYAGRPDIERIISPAGLLRFLGRVALHRADPSREIPPDILDWDVQRRHPDSRVQINRGPDGEPIVTPDEGATPAEIDQELRAFRASEQMRRGERRSAMAGRPADSRQVALMEMVGWARQWLADNPDKTLLDFKRPQLMAISGLSESGLNKRMTTKKITLSKLRMAYREHVGGA